MLREASATSIPSMLATVLGMEEALILKTLVGDPCDVMSIHFMTGIPVHCIEAKIRALVGLGLVKTLDDGRFICDDESRLVGGFGSL